ncbi:c-type cytochrome [Roseobacteraceae bacterium NS-SX3]
MNKPMAFLAFSALAAVAACAGALDRMPGPQQGRALFNVNCAACHGTDAVLASRTVESAAPDLRLIAARRGSSFPRAAVMSQIDGYGRGHRGATQMPEFGELLVGELVPVEVDGTLTPAPRPLAALLAYLESVQAEG